VKWAIVVLVVVLAAGTAYWWHGRHQRSGIDWDVVHKDMDSFVERKVFTEMDRKTLDSIKDDELESTLIEFITSKFDKDYTNEVEVVKSLSPGLRGLYATRAVEDEVNNGGFQQFYWNTSGALSKEAEEGFKLFGAAEYLSLMQQANEMHEAEKEKMQKYKDRGTSEAFSESYRESNLGELDDKFFKLKEDLSGLRVSYIRKHPEEFMSK